MMKTSRQSINLLVGAALSAGLCGWMLQAVAELPAQAGGLTEAVDAAMPQSGVAHPVTAVLLNFRGYDTWLELGVLLLACFGVLLAQPENGLERTRRLPMEGALMRWSVGLLLPLAVLVAGHLLWVGKYASGGAFQAGVVLGSALVLIWLAGIRKIVVLPGGLFRPILALGFVAFLGCAVGLLLLGPGLLTFPPASAGNFILFIEACATLSIAWTMVTLILGQPSARWEEGGSA